MVGQKISRRYYGLYVEIGITFIMPTRDYATLISCRKVDRGVCKADAGIMWRVSTQFAYRAAGRIRDAFSGLRSAHFQSRNNRWHFGVLHFKAMSAYSRTLVIRSVELASQSASAAVRADLSRGLTSLASIAATASFVGFFGTVVGLMNSFPSIGGSRSTALAEVARRISDAMVPGILGLFVAIIAFWFHQYLLNQLQAFDLETQNASVDLVNRLIVHLERLRTTNSTVWKTLTGIPSKAVVHLEASADRVLHGPRLVWAPMYRHGLLELIWPQLKSEFDAAPALDTAAWVCFGCSLLGWLAYWAQHRLVTGFLVLAFLIVAGVAIRRGSRVAVVVTLAYLLTVIFASIRSYGLTPSALCVAAVLVPLGGALRAVRWHVPNGPMRRSLRYG